MRSLADSSAYARYGACRCENKSSFTTTPPPQKEVGTSPRKPASNRKRPEYPNLSLASAEDVPCFAASAWSISERNPLTSAAPEPSQKLTAHRPGDVPRYEVASWLRVLPQTDG